MCLTEPSGHGTPDHRVTRWFDRNCDALILAISTDDQKRCPPLSTILSNLVRGVKNLKNLNGGDTVLSHLILVFLIEGEVFNIWP